MLLPLFQGSALVSRAEADLDRLHAGIDAALDALRQRWPNLGRLRAQGRPSRNQQARRRGLHVPPDPSTDRERGAGAGLCLPGSHLKRR
jgi:hypothetical protein